jgi:hypothetical protein
MVFQDLFQLLFNREIVCLTNRSSLNIIIFHLELTATGSLVPGTKLLTRERPNSANFPPEQGSTIDILVLFFYF